MSTKYEYPKAPVYRLDDVPAYKAGEWPGIKSNRFENTRRIIHPVCSGIIYSENEPPLKPRRKLLGPGYSQEYAWHPSIKIVHQIHEKKKTTKYADELFPALSDGRAIISRRCYFQDIENYHNDLQEKERQIALQNAIVNRSDNSNTNKTGFTKQFFENISNNKLLGIHVTKEAYTSYFMSTQKLPKIKSNSVFKGGSYWKQEELRKISDIKMEQDNLKRDIDYVCSLKDHNEGSKEK